MSTKRVIKKNLKVERAKLHEKLSSLKQMMSDFKVERRTNWKAFKNSMKDEVSKIRKSIDKLSTRKLDRPIEISLSANGSAHGKVPAKEIG